MTIVSCSKTPLPPDFEKMSHDLIYGSLALSPVSATQAGLHNYNNVPLDELIDDYSAPGLDQIRKFYQSYQAQFAALDQSKLDKEQKADLQLINDNIGYSFPTC